MNFKNLLILVFIGTATMGFSQTFNCSAITHSGTGEEIFFTFSDFVCNEGMDSNDPSDDFLEFTVTSANGNSSQFISGFSMGQEPFIVSASPFNNTSLTNPGEVRFHFGSSAFVVTIGAPSVGCAPLDLTLNWSSSTPPCPAENFTVAAAAAVPTLGQWGLIILCSLMFIFSVIVIKQFSIVKEQTYPLS